MKSNYKPIGKYIQRVEHRNRDLKVTRLLGLSMTKEFRETTSNIVGTDMSVYRVMSKYQFACDFMSPIRVNKLPVVLKLDDEPNLVSPAYPVFEIKDRNELDPEYLMMWFRRPEFDRYATFKCDAAIRGGYEWTELCETLIPVPSITKQREIVKEYNVIQNRIALNLQLIQKLEETAQAIYKAWFVEFEFPDENGKPYKSNGGKMIFNDELGKEIPILFSSNKIGNLSLLITDFVANGSFESLAKNVKYSSEPTSSILIRLTDYNNDFGGNFIYISNEAYEFLRKSKLQGGEIIISNVGVNIGTTFRCPKLNLKMSLGPNSIMLKSALYENYLYLLFTNNNGQKLIEEIIEGSAQPKFNKTNFRNIKLLVPPNQLLINFNSMFDSLTDYQEIVINENRWLIKMKDLLLSKLATIEN